MACQPEGVDKNNSPEVPYYHSQKALHDTIVTAIEQDKIANIDGMPGEEVSTDEITGIINKRGDCLFVDDYLIMIQTEELSFTEAPLALVDESNLVTFKVGDTITLAGGALDATELEGNDIGSHSEYKNPYLYECDKDKIWLTTAVVY